ncbi:MAG: SDR family oxidoreductase [Bacteroidetes bacterium]|nr:SDR family oxidoreductase [Bacteroidota bacterium]
MKYLFKNKVAIVTGSSSGIGLATARLLAEKGAKVVLAARNKEKLDEIVKELKENGTNVFAVKTDVSSEQDCKNLIEETVNHYKAIDILINNAGISMRALFKDVDLGVIRTLMEVNFFGTVYCTKYALPYLMEAKGSVIGVSSVAGFHGMPGRIGYSASKHAMHGFMNSLRIENLKTGLHVMLVIPGFTASNVRKSALVADGSVQCESPRKEGKMMMPEEVAKAILKGIRRKKKKVLLTFLGKGSAIMQKWYPSYLDWLFYYHLAKEPDSPFE